MSGERRWVVRAGDGVTLGEIVRRAGGDDGAIAEGRVFVGRARATKADRAVVVGDVVVVAPPSEAAADGDDGAVRILARTLDLLAVDKPAGIPTIPDHGGAAHALLARAARAAGLSPADLHPTSRLDREVSGVVVFALTPAGAARLQRARDEGHYARRYVALAARAPSEATGRWDAPLGRAADPRRRVVAGRDATDAVTDYRVVARAAGVALLAVAPRTGRTHQIRVHASHAGAPLLGDRVYGGPTRLTIAEGPGAGRVLPLRRIALHAARVVVPDANEPLRVTADVPAALREVWSALGGDAGAWDTAVSCDIP